ncbi:hypothetical protein Peur_045999 [Populus x canadensis]
MNQGLFILGIEGLDVTESWKGYICSDLQIGLRFIEIFREKIHCERFKPFQREFRGHLHTVYC